MKLDDLNTRIEKAERFAMVKSVCGQWTRADDDELAALYAERSRHYLDLNRLTQRQLDGCACMWCGAEPIMMRPVRTGPHGQLFECATPNESRCGSSDWSNNDE